MAKALQCPSCHTKHRLDGVGSVSMFRCTKCGQRLKVPPALRGKSAPRTVSTGTGGAGSAPAPPRRRPRPRLTAGDGAPSAPPAAAAPAPGAPSTAAIEVPDVGRAASRKARRRGASAPRKPPREALPLVVRVAAWLLALPIGLVIVGIPGRKLGYLTGQKMLDVIVKHDIGRFAPLLVIIVLWALATTVLVEVFIEGGRWLMLRRRARGAGEGLPLTDGFGSGGLGGAGVTVAPPAAPAPPSRRQGRSVAARRGS